MGTGVTRDARWGSAPAPSLDGIGIAPTLAASEPPLSTRDMT